jgi:hypothetical protein
MAGGLSHHFILFYTSVILLTMNLILRNLYVHELRRQIVLMTVFYVHVTAHRDKNLCKKKPKRCTNFTIYFVMKLYMFSDSSSVHHQDFIHCTFTNGIRHTGTVHTAIEQDQGGTAVPSWSCSKAVYKSV